MDDWQKTLSSLITKKQGVTGLPPYHHILTPQRMQILHWVAHEGGFAAATKHLKNLQRNTISEHMSQLEKELELQLFERKPFRLTPLGQGLFEFGTEFFSRLPTIIPELLAKQGLLLNIGVPELVSCHYLAKPLRQMRKKTFVVLHDGDETTFEAMLRQNQINIGLTILESFPQSVGRSLLRRPDSSVRSSGEGKNLGGDAATAPPFKLQFEKLLELPLTLVVPQKCKWKSAEQLWVGGEIKDALVWLSEKHACRRHFREGLEQRGIEVPPGFEVGRSDSIESYVREGNGVGVSVLMPHMKKLPGLRMLPLKGFAPVHFGMVWCGPVTEPMKAFMELVRTAVKKF